MAILKTKMVLLTEALALLETAYAGLIPKDTTVTEMRKILEAKIDEVNDITADGYRESVYNAFKAALEDAKKKLTSNDVQEIEDAYIELCEKYEALKVYENKDAAQNTGNGDQNKWNGSQNGSTIAGKAVQTGDTSGMIIIMVTMLMSGVAVVLSLRRKGR